MTVREWIVNRENRKSVTKTANLLTLNVAIQIAVMIGLALTGALIVFSLYKTAGINILSIKDDVSSMGSPLGLAIQYFSYIPAFLIPPVFYILLRKRPLKELISFKAPKVSSVFVSFFGIMTLALPGLLFTSLIGFLLERIGYRPKPFSIEAPDGWALGILFVVILSVLPALLEEFSFRGVVMGEMRRYNGWAAVILSSFMFSLMHLNVSQIPYALFVGFGISYFVIKFNSIWIGVIFHFINNAISAAEAYIFKYYPAQESFINIGIFGLYIFMFLTGVLILIPFLVMNGIKLPKKEGEISFGLAMRGILISPVLYSTIALLLLLTLTSIEKI